MKSFLLKIFILLTSILITCLVIEYLLRQIPNDYKLKQTYLEKKSNEIEVLFLGGSHTLHGINPELVSKNSFNASHNSQSLEYDLAILQKYSNKWSNLKYIVVSVSYPSLFSDLKSDPEAWRAKNYILYYDIRIANKLVYNAEIMNGLLWTNLNRIKEFYLKGKDNVECTPLGWAPYIEVDSSANLAQTGIDAVLRHTIPDDGCFEMMQGVLDSIVRFASDNNCKLLLFTSPVHKSYSDNLNQTQWKMTKNALTKADLMNNHCLYFDLMNDSRFTETDFYDGDHLNKAGAIRLTLLIDTIINSQEGNDWERPIN